ncbi:mechanosensitive ion channel domain-containing protein [Thioalkalivibrio sp. XN8]|uniref:mechanosensitive ion channel family protein n=1 Tax=Thioalkalivibrio sp. XN8 TaxID=2712863 RepID=UPI0013EB6D12|nr:mechanosensitive ion channel domain-containing protein [Thioalkalivibrio sp. XN8]NGP53746.1 mechanosensitive ion channel [Thioalkalivibrio sp. XN8]
MQETADIVDVAWQAVRPWAEGLGILGIGAAAGLLAAFAVRLALNLVLARRDPALADSLRRRCMGVLASFLPLLGIYLALPATDRLVEIPWLHAVLVSLLVFHAGFLLVRLVRVLEDALGRRLQMDVADNLQARKFHTQFRILRQVLTLIIWLLTGAAILLQFDGFRQFGQGLLASAGIASLVIGFAAQRTLGNLIAGFQIALTQPIRLDDVVVVENEWGRIEEITLTYVVVKIWDERRLVLPISYFLENPFTNWTRSSAEILGTVFLHVDYTVPVDALRAELERLVRGHEDWDERVAEIIAFEARPTTYELRALVSARDSGAAWRLRCHVREGLVSFLQREYPEALPRFRVGDCP